MEEEPIRSKDVSLSLFGDCYKLLRQYPVIAVFVAFSVIGTCASIIIMIDQLSWIESTVSDLSFVSDTVATPIAAYLGIAGIFFLATFVVSFCNVAIIRCTKDIIDGEQPSLGRSMKEAVRGMSAILLHSIIMGVIGFLIAVVEREGSLVAKVTVYLFGISYALLSFFAFQAMVLGSKGPVSMYFKSAEVSKERFGDITRVSLGLYGLIYLIANLTLGIILLLLVLGLVLEWLGIELLALAVARLFLLLRMPDDTFLVAGVVLLVPILLIPVGSNFAAMLKTAMYVDTVEGRSPEILEQSVEYVNEVNRGEEESEFKPTETVQ